MSKSLGRVTQALKDAGVDIVPQDIGAARTAAEAAASAGCAVDQIAKSIIFLGEDSDRVVLFITAGGNQVDAAKASALAGESLGKADADAIRKQTGFAIGGVAPIGHISKIRTFWDPKLSTFDTIFAAAGTPRHVFEIAPTLLLKISSAQPSDFTS